MLPRSFGISNAREHPVEAGALKTDWHFSLLVLVRCEIKRSISTGPFIVSSSPCRTGAGTNLSPTPSTFALWPLIRKRPSPGQALWRPGTTFSGGLKELEMDVEPSAAPNYLRRELDRIDSYFSS
jgi:hypothetical protein